MQPSISKAQTENPKHPKHKIHLPCLYAEFFLLASSSFDAENFQHNLSLAVKASLLTTKELTHIHTHTNIPGY